MTRTVITTHRFPRTALALGALLLAACGEKPPAGTATAGAETPAATIINASVTTREPAPLPTAAGPVMPASFADAESVYRAGDYAAARRFFQSYVEARPENPWGHYMLGLSAWKSGDLPQAEAAFERAITLDSTQIKSYLNGARVLLDLGRNHEALERAEQARRLDAGNAETLRLIARARHAMGQADAAIEAYRGAILLDDRDVWAMNNLGVLYLDRGEPDLALAPLARAVQLRNTAPVFQNNLGIALERSGHVAAARSAYEAAIRADSSYAKAITSLARVNGLVADPADLVDLDELAQVFRMQVGMWRDNAALGGEPALDSLIKADTLTGAGPEGDR